MSFAKKLVDINDYFVIEEISNNESCIMKKAIEKKTGRFVFLFESRNDKEDDDVFKVFQKNALRHIKICFHLHHPAILKVKKFIIYNRYGLTLITKFLTNWNISALTKEYLDTKGQNKNKMNPLIRSKIIFGIASAMKYLHQQNIIIRYLTLENIFLDDNYEPKILISLIYDFDKFINTNNYFYISPEFILGGSYSCSIDVYSFAFVVYKMFSKKFLYGSDVEYFYRFRFCNKVWEGMRPLKPDLMPDCYWDLVSACFSQDPSDHPSFHQIVETLKDDKFAIQEFGMKTDIRMLHEYQKRIFYYCYYRKDDSNRFNTEKFQIFLIKIKLLKYE